MNMEICAHCPGDARTTANPQPQKGPIVHRLPNEILLYIFIYYNDSSSPHRRPYELSYRPCRRQASNWTPLMLVCRRWRELGRTSASLWRAVDIESDARWLNLALDRSQEAALELYFHSPSIAISSIPQLIRQAHRIRKLMLPAIKGSDLPTLEHLLSFQMPILHELRMWVDEHGSDRPQAAPAAIRFCASHFPSLQHIRLSHVTFQWDTSAVSKLRSMHLHKCHSLDPTLSFDRFLDVLASCAELEELRLHRFISTINHDVPAGFESNISLPRLRKLVIGDVPPLTILFLSSVTITSSMTLRIVGWIDSPGLGDWEHRLFRSLLPTDRTRVPHLQSVTWVEFRGYDYNFHVNGQCPGSGSIKLKLCSHHNVDLEELYTERGLMEVADIFHLAPVTGLDVYCNPDTIDDPEVWDTLLAGFPRVRSLHVLPGQVMRPIWHALGGRTYPMDAENADVKALMCPELRNLSMDYLRWDQESMDYILGSLRRRHIRGLPKLDSLSIAFTYALEPHRKDIVVSETDRMIPCYEDHLATYTAEFEWGRS